MRWKRKVAIVGGLLMLGTCGLVVCSRRGAEYAPSTAMDEAPTREEGRYAKADAPPPPGRASGGAPMPQAALGTLGSRGALDMDKRDSSGKDDKKPGDDGPSEAPAQKRMLHYNGYARLRVDSPKKAGEEASKIAMDNGGFVEQLTSNAITIRIPVEKFRAVLALLLKLGDVVDKSVTAEDVTDAFAAIELRLQTAKTSRDRLIALLAKARTEREKLDLLREIQRLTMQIDELENASKTLVSLASYSRISLSLEERSRSLDAPTDEPVAAFQWIHRLNAFRRDVAFEGKKLKVEVPKGFVQLDDKQHWVSESADAAVYWASKRDNKPKGTTRFWVDAVKERLSPEFAKVEEKEAGQFTVLRFLDRSDTPYRYLVALRANGDDLEVIEAHFPGDEQEKRYSEAVLASITKGAL